MARKSASGSGSIRKRTVTRNGKTYTYWEARVTTGRNPGTGKQVQRSFTGKTQKEVREKMQAAAVSLTEGTYLEPNRMTVGEWLDIWGRDYLSGVKKATLEAYKNQIKNHIKPALGAVRLQQLHPHMVQNFVNGLKDLSASSVRTAFVVLHMAMEQAVRLGYIQKNPATFCKLPRRDRAEVKPLSDDESIRLLDAAKGTDMETLITTALFTGMRFGEILGMTWDRVDFQRGTIKVDRQLARKERQDTDGNIFSSPKSGKGRTVSAAPTVMKSLRKQQSRQAQTQLKAGPQWANPDNLVFTTETGGPLNHRTVISRFKALLVKAVIEGVHFHQLRHTYAVNALRAGDDIKTVQGNLGHARAAITLDVYASFTEQMRDESAERMEVFIKDKLNQ